MHSDSREADRRSSPNGATVSRYVACPLDGLSIAQHEHTDEANDEALIGEDADKIETYSLKSYHPIETPSTTETIVEHMSLIADQGNRGSPTMLAQGRRRLGSAMTPPTITMGGSVTIFLSPRVWRWDLWL